jgi:hypothetical protein
MKKLLPLLFLGIFISFAASSQNLSLSDANGPIPDNGNIYVVSDNPDLDIVAHVFVTNNGSSTIDSVKVFRNQISMVADSWSQFCWYVCFPPSTDTSGTAIAIEPGATNDEDFSGHYWSMGNPGESIVSYTFYDHQNPDDNVTVIVNYKLSLAGIGEHLSENSRLSSPYPNPAESFVSFDYDIPNEVNRAEILITNLLGAVVYEGILNGLNGTKRIDVSNFTEGIYFATLKLDNHIATSQKILVQ